MKRLLSRWYWRYRLDLLLGRLGYVPLSEFRKLQDSYMRVCAENWNRDKDQRFAVCNQPCGDVSWCDNGCRRIIVSTDYKQAPCS